MKILLQRLYHLYFGRVKSAGREIVMINSKSSAEVKEKYFANVKFSTQMLKTLCKRMLAPELSVHSSTD